MAAKTPAGNQGLGSHSAAGRKPVHLTEISTGKEERIPTGIGELDRVLGYLLSKPGATTDFKIEWQWQRYQVGSRLFAATLCPGAHYSAEYAGRNLLTLKCDPMLAELYRREHPEVLPGFYTDKRCWNSIDLGGTLPDSLLRQMIDESYRLVFGTLTKKMQRELLAGTGAPDGI